MRRPLLLLVLLALPLCPGCNCIDYMLYAFSPEPPSDTVEAEYAGLANSTLAVVIYADPSVLYEYPGLRLNLSRIVSYEIRKNVENVTVIPPERVARFQAENLYWDSTPRNQLAEQLGADQVLFISLIEYATVVPGSTNLFRGHLVAEASVHKASLPRRTSCVWRSDDLRVNFPEDATAGRPAQSDQQVAYITQKIFADKLAKHFYTHEVPRDEEGKRGL